MLWRFAMGAVLGLAAAGVSAYGLAARADSDDGITPSLRARILIKTLTYDRNLTARTQAVVQVGILHRDDDASRGSAERLRQAFADEAVRTVSGRRLLVALLPFSDVGSLDASLAAKRIQVLYVADGFDDQLDTIADATRKHDIISFGGRRGYVERKLSLGLFVIDGRPRIVINLRASKEEGIDFDGGLLRHSLVIK